MRSPSRQELRLKVKGAEIQKPCLQRNNKGKEAIVDRTSTSSNHGDMRQRDVNRCAPSPERAYGLAGQAAKSCGTINHNTVGGSREQQSQHKAWWLQRGTTGPWRPHHPGWLPLSSDGLGHKGRGWVLALKGKCLTQGVQWFRGPSQFQPLNQTQDMGSYLVFWHGDSADQNNSC